jgi:hypothetical protein
VGVFDVCRPARLGLLLFVLLGCSAQNAAGGAATVPSHLVATTAVQGPACPAGQLAMAYLVGLPGTGNDIGTIVIWDQSPRVCWLSGPLHLAGLNRAGHQVTNSVRYVVAGDAKLTARGSRPDSRERVKPGELLASLHVIAEYRDDPVTGGLCTAHQVEPATWRLWLPSGASITAPNADHYQLVKNITRDNGLTTCRGRLDQAFSPVTVGPAVN